MQKLIDLVRKAQQGDLRAFDSLIQRFRDMAVGYAYSILGDFHLAEDAAQEALHWALQIVRIPLVQEDCWSGLAAYEAWAQAIRQEDEFIDKKVEELHHRYHVHMDATGMIAEGRWYAYQFLQKIMEDVSCPKEEMSQERWQL